MLCKSKKVITVATDAELLNKHYYLRLWLAVRNCKVSRRDWPDLIADAIRDFDGDFVYCSGQLFPVPEVDDVFGDDPDMRWMGHYLEADHSGLFPKVMSKKLDRLRMIDLLFRITRPKLAAHFKR